MIRLLTFFLCFSLLGCPRSNQGNRLFEVNYSPLDFVIPAGQPSFQTFVIAQPRLVTEFITKLTDLNLDESDVDAVGGRRARISSISGEDFSEIERIELRVCSAEERGCSQFDIMFSVSDLTGRRQNVVNLNPGLRNFRPLYLENEEVRVELIIFPSSITSQTIEARLEWGVQAVGDL